MPFHDPALDQQLQCTALDPSRAQQLLTPRSKEDLEFLSYLAQHAPRGGGIVALDSLVRVSLVGFVPEPQAVRAALDQAVWVACALEKRRALLPPTAAEFAIQQEWRAFADQHQLRFDPARMHLEGHVGGTWVSFSLDTHTHRVGTLVTARFPRSLPHAIYVSKAGPLHGLARLFTQGLTLGDPAFDRAFASNAATVGEVRAVFADPHVRAALLRAAEQSDECELHPAGLSWTLPRPLASSAELSAQLALALRVSHGLFGASARP